MAPRALRFLLVTSLLTPAVASAQRIATRADLNGILTSQTIETFDAFTPVVPATAAALRSGGNTIRVLDATTSIDNFPLLGATGLVNEFLRFSVPLHTSGQPSDGRLQINGPGYFGMTSANLTGADGPLTIFFLSAVRVVGVDLTDYAIGGLRPFTVSAFGPGNALLGTVNYSTISAPGSAFFGWEDAGTIDHIDVGFSGQQWSAAIDNVTFGTPLTAAPEPANF